ncbi:hypothetical protein BJX66DRAFT_330974 [Aspergillus keveii]|uniref:Uncharacterized protein n=1 Tax=Aspergillus keveii TaxID=714993 RepID=A0ABR4FHZ1_9EURO
MNAPWKIGWRVNQTWVKNNRDAEYHLFSIPIWDQDTPTFTSALYLLALALSNNALLGYSSADDIWEQRIPPASITTRQFNEDFRRVMNNTDYFKTTTIHAVRRALGAVMDKKYSRAQVAQVLTYKTQEIYRQDYVAHITRVDTVNSLLGNKPDTTLADYFQGFGQFNKRGLPSELPAERLIKLQYDPTLMEIDRKLSPDVTERTTKKRALYNVMPELGRLVKRILSDKPLTFVNKLQVTKDLHALSTRDNNIIYLPGGEPVDGCYPASTYGASINQ